MATILNTGPGHCHCGLGAGLSCTPPSQTAAALHMVERVKRDLQCALLPATKIADTIAAAIHVEHCQWQAVTDGEVLLYSSLN